MENELRIEVPRGHVFAGQLQHAMLLALLLPGAWALAGPVLAESGGRADLVRRQSVDRGRAPDPRLVRLAHAARLSWHDAALRGATTSWSGGSCSSPCWSGGGVVLAGLGGRGRRLPGLARAGGAAARPGLPRPGARHLPLRAPALRHPARPGGATTSARATAACRWSAPALFGGARTRCTPFGFLLLWGIAFLYNSRAAAAAALFQHAYIWVHMYCTEGPDIRLLHDDRPSLPDRVQ